MERHVIATPYVSKQAQIAIMLTKPLCKAHMDFFMEQDGDVCPAWRGVLPVCLW